MFRFFLIVAVLVAIAVAGLAIGILIKGKFPDTHVGRNADMKKMGITCAKNDSALCQGRPNSEGCRGCSCAG
ncbi:MAG: hypothetical protein LBL24_02520 [Bacteroidales bacterium]|jgi:hypothetical protein|nr:hypothetical protein [Bacteroidales bacterium]